MYDPKQLDEVHARLEDGVTHALAEGDYQSAARHAYAIDALKKWQAAGYEGSPPADAQELAGMELTPLPEEPPALPGTPTSDEATPFDLNLDALLPPDEQALEAQLAAGQDALQRGQVDGAPAAFEAVAGQAQRPDLRIAALSALVQAQRTQLATPLVAAPSELAGFDPGLERRLRRTSLLSGLASALAMAVLLLMGGWLLARSLQPTDWETELAATEQARAIQSAVAVSFAVQQATADGRATVAAQATQVAVAATATRSAEEGFEATATALAAPTATAIAEATATAEALAAMLTDDFAIVWPDDGAAMAVAPWEVMVRRSLDRWPDGSYTLLLNDQPIHRFAAARQSAYLVYTRTIEDFFDGFPGLSTETLLALDMQDNGELPEGAHRLQVALDQDGDGSTDRLSQPVGFVIDMGKRITATLRYVGPAGVSRLEAPGAPQGRFVGQGIVEGEVVVILGKALSVVDGGSQLWYLWQAPAVQDDRPRPPYPERRGWSRADLFELPDGFTSDDVPYIALPQAG